MIFKKIATLFEENCRKSPKFEIITLTPGQRKNLFSNEAFFLRIEKAIGGDWEYLLIDVKKFVDGFNYRAGMLKPMRG
jgi:hypothetical protein